MKRCKGSKRRKTAAGLRRICLSSERKGHPAKDGGFSGSVLYGSCDPAARARNAQSPRYLRVYRKRAAVVGGWLRLTYQISEETRRKAELSRREAESLVEWELKCPECGYKVGTVFQTVQDI